MTHNTHTHTHARTHARTHTQRQLTQTHTHTHCHVKNINLLFCTNLWTWMLLWNVTNAAVASCVYLFFRPQFQRWIETVRTLEQQNNSLYNNNSYCMQGCNLNDCCQWPIPWSSQILLPIQRNDVNTEYTFWANEKYLLFVCQHTGLAKVWLNYFLKFLENYETQPDVYVHVLSFSFSIHSWECEIELPHNSKLK
jgi:hypothetical protein